MIGRIVPLLVVVLGGCIYGDDLSDTSIRNDCGYAVLAETEATLADIREADRLKRFEAGETAYSSSGPLDLPSIFVEAWHADDIAGSPLEVEIPRSDFIVDPNGDVLLVLAGALCP